MGQQADSLDEEYKGEEEEPAEEDGIAEDDEADPPPEGDVEMEGTHKFRLVYQGLARAFLITELSPACRYCFRLRFMGEEGRSGWSAGLVADTDAADSAHRIDFESLGVFETLGEGAFSVVYRGTWNREGSSQQVARVFGRGRGREGGEGQRDRGKEERRCEMRSSRGIGGGLEGRGEGGWSNEGGESGLRVGRGGRRLRRRVGRFAPPRRAMA